MRILLVPVFNYAPNLNADSIYLISGDWAKALCDQDDSVHVYRILPRMDLKGRTEKFGCEYSPVHERVHDVFVKQNTYYTAEETNVPHDVYGRFHPVLGDTPVDVVVSTSSVKMVFLRAFFDSLKEDQVSYVNLELLIRGEGTNEVSTIRKYEPILQATGQLLAKNLFQSPKCKRIAMSSSRSIFSASSLKKAFSDSEMVYSGYSGREAFVPDSKNERFTLLMRGRMTPSKNLDLILEVYNRLYESGHDLDILLTTGDSLRGGKAKRVLGEELSRNDNIELSRFPTKDDAMKAMRGAHAFVFWSSHELFAVSVWEMLASGLIGVFKDADWHKGLLPKDYPYIFSSREEAYAMIKHVMLNYKAVKEELAWLPGWVKEKYEYQNTTRKSYTLLKESMESPKLPGWVLTAFKSAPDVLTWEEAEKHLLSSSDHGEAAYAKTCVGFRILRALTPLELLKALRGAGYREVKSNVFQRLEGGGGDAASPLPKGSFAGADGDGG